MSSASVELPPVSPVKEVWWRNPDLIVNREDADHYTCTICTSILRNPVELPCEGHLFCQDCWDQWSSTRNAQDLICPFCRAPVNPSEVRQTLSARRYIEHTLRLRCQHHEDIVPLCCDKVLTMGNDGMDALIHEKSGCVKVNCTSCTKEVSPTLMDYHRDYECTYICEDCKDEILCKRKEAHTEWENAKKRATECRRRIQELEEEIERTKTEEDSKDAMVKEHDWDGDRPPRVPEAQLTISVKYDDKEIFTRVKPSTTIRKITLAICKQQFVSDAVVVMTLRGRLMERGQTVEEARIRDGDRLELKRVEEVY